jgi:hypothetical protein
VAGPISIDTLRPHTVTPKPRRRLLPRRHDGADCLDADALKAMQHSLSEALRREYGQAPAFAIDTAGEMVNEAYAEYAEKSETERAEVRNLPGLLVTTAEPPPPAALPMGRFAIANVQGTAQGRATTNGY